MTLRYRVLTTVEDFDLRSALIRPPTFCDFGLPEEDYPPCSRTVVVSQTCPRSDDVRTLSGTRSPRLPE
jgi:hypothetical protein